MHVSHRRFRPARVPRCALSLLLVLGPALNASIARAADEETLEGGRSLFRIYCANCHGESATGGGPTAKYLTVEPPDLTRLARRNGGKFPAEQVARIVDGREAVRTHGEREMPLWGLAFRDWNVDTDQEGQVRARIARLVAYLESIQRD